MKTETYICNGKRFASYGAVIGYCEQNNFRVTNTQTIKKGTFLVSVTAIN